MALCNLKNLKRAAGLAFTVWAAVVVFGLIQYKPITAWQSAVLVDGDCHAARCEPADAVVVLGTSVFTNGDPTPSLRERLLLAVELLQNEVSSNVVLTGGFAPGYNHSESAVMFNWMVSHLDEGTTLKPPPQVREPAPYEATDAGHWSDLISVFTVMASGDGGDGGDSGSGSVHDGSERASGGVPRTGHNPLEREVVFYLEEGSTSTKLNAENIVDVVRARGWKSLVVVTNGYHQYRSRRVFEKVLTTAGLADVEVRMVAAPDARHVTNRMWLREILATGLYIAMRWI